MHELLFDPADLVAIQRFFGPGAHAVFRALNLTGDAWGLIALVALVRWRQGLRRAYGVLGAVLLGLVVYTPVMLLFDVDRPRAPGLVAHEQIDVPSFPSGHVVTATVLWGILAAWRVLPRGVAVAAVALASLSRLYLGMHFVGDVLAGAALGGLVVAGYVALWPRVERRWSRQPPQRIARGLTFGPLGLLVVAAAASLLGSSPKVWSAAGAAAGAAMALTLEYRVLGYEPAPLGRRRRATQTALGLGGLALLWLADQGLRGIAAPVHGALTAAAALWALLAAPALFVRLGLAQRRRAGGDGPAAGAAIARRVRGLLHQAAGATRVAPGGEVMERAPSRSTILSLTALWGLLFVLAKIVDLNRYFPNWTDEPVWIAWVVLGFYLLWLSYRWLRAHRLAAR